MNTISVTAPVEQAINRVQTVLFRPFDLGKWFTIGFCAWLAYLCEGGGFHGNFGGGHQHGGESARAQLEHIRDYIVSNMAWLAPLAIVALVIIVAVCLLLIWLSSRGRFMFLHCVALNTAQVEVPWRKYAAEANSLFLFRTVVALVSTVIFLPLFAALGIVIVRMIIRAAVTPGGILGGLGLLLAMIVAGILLWVVSRFTRDFVVPIQYLKQMKCLHAWRELLALLHGNLGRFILYLLFRVVLAIGMSVVVLAVVLVTCCIAGCLLLVPYIGTVLLLPVLVFERSYSLMYLAQYGPEYNVFAPVVSPDSSSAGGMAPAQ